MATRPEFLSFEVGDDGSALGALAWDGILGAPTVVAVHGITANAWAWDPVVHHLHGAAKLVAVDLRGRGRSLDAPGPYGIRQHADDIADVIGQLDGPVLLVGHSLGAVVALMTAARWPSRVRDLVLVDGGPPLTLRRPTQTGDDLDALLDRSLGPAIERIRTIWPDRVSYHAMWAQHPAYVDGIGPDLERNLLADLIEVEGGFRTAVDEAAVRQDGRELLADADVRSLLDRRTEPTTIVRAEFGMFGEPPPLIPDEIRDAFPQHRWIEAAGTNHYTVLNSAAGAELVADTIRRSLIG